MKGSEPRLVQSGPLPYLLSLPRESATPSSAGLPVLAFLHGHDEGAPMEIRQALTRHGPLAAASSRYPTGEFIIVAPQLPVRGDHWLGQADAVEEIARQVQREHGGDPARSYLTGFSFGGNGVFDLAARQRELWAALWAVDPTRVPAADPGLPVWLSSGEVSRRAARAFVEQLHLQPLHGAADPGDRVFLDRGLDHVGTAEVAYRDDRIYRWLLSRRRAAGEA